MATDFEHCPPTVFVPMTSPCERGGSLSEGPPSATRESTIAGPATTLRTRKGQVLK